MPSSVFDSSRETVTKTSDNPDIAINPGLFTGVNANAIASISFLSSPLIHSGSVQVQVQKDSSCAFFGTLIRSINNDYDDFIDGKDILVFMGQSDRQVYGTERIWYRPEIDVDNTLANYYSDVDTKPADLPTTPIDPATYTGPKVEATFNQPLSQFQWGGFTQIRLVDDNITHGSSSNQLKLQHFQYGNLSATTKGNNTALTDGDSTSEVQGSTKMQLDYGSYIKVGTGLSTFMFWSSEGGEDNRLKSVEDDFNSAEQNALQKAGQSNLGQPSGTQVETWDSLDKSYERFPIPLMFLNVQGLQSLLNLNIEGEVSLMRNAFTVVGTTARWFKLAHKAVFADVTALKAKLHAVSQLSTALNARIGAAFGVPRVIPAPAAAAPEEFEMDEEANAGVQAAAGLGAADAGAAAAGDAGAAAGAAEAAAEGAVEAAQVVEEAGAADEALTFEEAMGRLENIGEQTDNIAGTLGSDEGAAAGGGGNAAAGGGNAAAGGGNAAAGGGGAAVGGGAAAGGGTTTGQLITAAFDQLFRYVFGLANLGLGIAGLSAFAAGKNGAQSLSGSELGDPQIQQESDPQSESSFEFQDQ